MFCCQICDSTAKERETEKKIRRDKKTWMDFVRLHRTIKRFWRKLQFVYIIFSMGRNTTIDETARFTIIRTHCRCACLCVFLFTAVGQTEKQQKNVPLCNYIYAPIDANKFNMGSDWQVCVCVWCAVWSLCTAYWCQFLHKQAHTIWIRHFV